MTRFAPSRRLTVVTALFVFILVATGCVPARMGVSWASVSIVGETQNILVAYDNFIVQLDPATGNEIQLRDADGNVRVVPETGEPRTWDYQDTSNPQQYYSAPLSLKEGKLLFANYAKRLVEVDLLAARVDNPAGIPVYDHIVAAPIHDENHLYVGYVNKDLQALKLDSPSVVVWTFETGNGVWAAPLLADGVLYFGSMDHNLYAVNAENGRELWRAPLGGAVAATPVLVDGVLYVGSFDRKIFAVSQDNGEILHQRDVSGWVWGAPVVVDDVLYAADMDGYVYALNTSDLSEKWRVRAANGGIRPSPLVTDQHVIIGARSGEVVWLERASGVIALESPRQLGAEILGDLVLVTSTENRPLAEPLVLVSTVAQDKLLVAYSAAQGVQQWVYRR